MSQAITRGGLLQNSAEIAPVSLGEFGLPNLLQMLQRLQSSQGSAGSSNSINAGQPLALGEDSSLSLGGESGPFGARFRFSDLFERML